MAHAFVTERTGEIQTISPAVAARWLERNTSNRPLNNNWIADLSAAMTRGEWMENGEAIKFSNTGALLDGQHRLKAVVRSGVTIKARVEFGLPDAAFITLDRGKKRNLSDALAMQGEENTHVLAAATALLWAWDNGIEKASRATPVQLLEYFENSCDGLSQSVRASWRAQRIIQGSIVVALHFRFSKFSRRLADEFMELLGSGENMDKTHPVFVLRERLFADRLSKARLPRNEITAMVINAWNAFASNRPLRVLKGTVDGAIPKIIGPTWTGEAEAS